MRSVSCCPSCSAPGLRPCYELKGVPVHSVLLMPTRQTARSYPTGDITLGFCEQCGFITNMLFDPGRHEYSERIEETQSFSQTFNAFHRQLALNLIERYNLRGKDVIEIGCGKGEFLTLLCEQGENRGIGFDPAYVPGRTPPPAAGSVHFISDFYSEQFAGLRADFYCCKMTLEHIQDTQSFVSIVRRSVGDDPQDLVFFQVPDVLRILQEGAFWDIYYEHCSYFSLGSLARLFRRCGFDPVDLWRDYDDQYLMIAARPGRGDSPALPGEDDLAALQDEVQKFEQDIPRELERWKERLRSLQDRGRRAVLWGGGSKAVAFLTTLGIQDEIRYAVDIDPHKQGTFLAGSGQKIVPPAFLKEYRPDLVILMNPIYRAEVTRDLRTLGLEPEIMSVNEQFL